MKVLFGVRWSPLAIFGAAIALATCVMLAANRTAWADDDDDHFARRGERIVVGSCEGSSIYPTIQDAVNAAPPGSTIKVCPGTYPEQVDISKNLTIVGISNDNQDAAVIAPPSSGMVQNAVDLDNNVPAAAQVFVHEATVNLRNLTVDGNNNQIQGCSPVLIGVFYQNASGTVSEVALRNQKLSSPALIGCQSGNALFVQSGNGGMSEVTVVASTAHDYQKNGFTGNDEGTVLVVEDSSARGQGPTSGAAENGIQIAFGATGRIKRNKVIDHIWAPCASASNCQATACGILVFNSPSVETRDNVEGNSQCGIIYASASGFPGGSADRGAVIHNIVFGTSVFDGIDMCSNRNKVIGNIVASSTESGIHLDSSCSATGNDNIVAGNVINEACAGILDGGSGNTIHGNRFANVASIILHGDTCPDPRTVAAAATHRSVSPAR